jgi:nicotinamidase/pyrazinamidase
MKKKSLIIIDLQNDFCPGGNLGVREGDHLASIANQLQASFDLVIATQDWHPNDHMSFASNHQNKKAGEVVSVNDIDQILWPDHCVQHSKGAELHPDLDMSNISNIFHKGIDKTIDSYSAFFDNAHLRSTGLGDYLKEQQVDEVYLMGIATDYCVKYSALDARKLGLDVHVIVDACRGVELKEGDVERSLREMKAAGVKLVYVDGVG